MFDQKEISPTGFLMHKEIKSYTMTASGHEYTDMPRDYPYRKLFVRCQYPGYEPYIYVDNIKLSEDQDKRIIFNHAPATIERNISENNPMLEELIYFPVKTAATPFYCTPTARTIGSVNTWSGTTGAGEIAFYDGDGGKALAIAATAAKNAQAKVSGWLPHATWEIPFGDQMDMADWYDVEKVGALKADIQASSSGTSSQSIQLFLQQLRKYGGAA